MCSRSENKLGHQVLSEEEGSWLETVYDTMSGSTVHSDRRESSDPAVPEEGNSARKAQYQVGNSARKAQYQVGNSARKAQYQVGNSARKAQYQDILFGSPVCRLHSIINYNILMRNHRNGSCVMISSIYYILQGNTIKTQEELSPHQSPSDHSFKKERETAYSRKAVKINHQMKHRHLDVSVCLGPKTFTAVYKEVEEREDRVPERTDVHPTRHSEGGSIVSVTPVAQTTGTPPTESKITRKQRPGLSVVCIETYRQLCLESPSAISHGHHISTGEEFPKPGQNFTAQFTDGGDDYGMS
ncbi:hypothetical protein STEG23_016787 [Scotinomys teguina]